MPIRFTTDFLYSASQRSSVQAEMPAFVRRDAQREQFSKADILNSSPLDISDLEGMNLALWSRYRKAGLESKQYPNQKMYFIKRSDYVDESGGIYKEQRLINVPKGHELRIIEKGKSQIAILIKSSTGDLVDQYEVENRRDA